ncbi:hypothetical protein J6590_023805 [Homalodisca vitripennis]|nr:hypothetical protein J6590_023805 [Homalodisca vitripennis]
MLSLYNLQSRCSSVESTLHTWGSHTTGLEPKMGPLLEDGRQVILLKTRNLAGNPTNPMGGEFYQRRAGSPSLELQLKAASRIPGGERSSACERRKMGKRVEGLLPLAYSTAEYCHFVWSNDGLVRRVMINDTIKAPSMGFMGQSELS